MSKAVHLTGQERFFGEDEIIVSKTDLKGRITYANRVFLNIAGYTEREVLNQPHSIIRHPAMPRCVFKLMWSILGQGNEIFAYVINRCKNGDHYWVYAHVTPSYDANGTVIGYHSNRRVPDRKVVDQAIIPLYRSLCEEEAKHASRKDGMNSAEQMVLNLLAQKGVGYDEFVASLG